MVQKNRAPIKYSFLKNDFLPGQTFFFVVLVCREIFASTLLMFPKNYPLWTPSLLLLHTGNSNTKNICVNVYPLKAEETTILTLAWV